jgi:hypothetical protein
MLRRSGCDCLRAKVFEERSGYAGEEVDIGRTCSVIRHISYGRAVVGHTVEATRQIGGDDLNVLRGRLNEIDDGYLAIISVIPFQSNMPHTSGIKCRVVPMFKCIVTWAHSQYIPRKARRDMPYARAPQIIHSEHRAYDVPPHLIEHQHLPYCAVGGRGGFMAGVVLCVNIGDGCVQIQYALDAG